MRIVYSGLQHGWTKRILRRPDRQTTLAANKVTATELYGKLDLLVNYGSLDVSETDPETELQGSEILEVPGPRYRDFWLLT